MGKNFKKGQMVKTTFIYSSNEQSPRTEQVAYGIIREIRYKSEIAYVEFLPLHNTENRWMTFASLDYGYT